MSNYFFSLNALSQALLATLITWLVTALGASTVYFFKTSNKNLYALLLSASAGIMCAASFWSLLEPARVIAYAMGIPEVITLCGGFMTGAFFLILADKIIDAEDNQSFMLILSITLHNIPEGLAIGIAFASAQSDVSIISACALSFGIALQNFPEGAAISLPLRAKGISKNKAFFMGQLSGFVEPISSIMGVYAVTKIKTLLPFALSFAAGAMLYVTVNELIPECMNCKNRLPSTICFIFGFVVMTALDVGIG